MAATALRATLLACNLILFALPASAKTILHSQGGLIPVFMHKVQDAWFTPMVRIDGYCASACTLWLLHPGVCVTPRARLLFHKASGEHGAAYMLRKFDQHAPWVSEWIEANGGLTETLIEMPASEAARHTGYC